MSPTTDAPTPDPVEARLRAALDAEADRHPVTPAFEDLRTRADRTVVDLRLPPRRNRARILATAAVVALLAAAVAAIAIGGADEDDEAPLITEQAPASGYYVPAAGWAIEQVVPFPGYTLPGAYRTVEFGAPMSDDDLGTVSVFVSRIEGPAPDLMALASVAGLQGSRAVDRGEGDDAREYVVAGHTVDPVQETPADDLQDGDDIDIDGGSLTASVDGLVLMVDWYGPVGEAAVVALADRWWTSDGQAVALDPVTGLDRLSDVTQTDVEPVPAEELATFGGMDDDADPMDTFVDAPVRIVVEVRSPDGWRGAYSLQAPGGGTPTGYEDEDGGAGVGLGPDEVGGPLPTEVGGAHRAWESGTGIAAEVPGALLSVDRTSFFAEPITAEHARELWAALVPADRSAWAAAVEVADAEVMVEAADWAPTLAGMSLSEMLADGGRIEETETETEELVPEVRLLPRDGVNPATGRPEDEVRRIVADAVLAFAGGEGSVDADLFGPTTSFVYDDGSAPLVVPIEEVAAGPDWDASEPPPATQAWYLLESLTPPEGSDVLDAPGECPPLDAVAAEPATVVLYQDLDPPTGDEEPCSIWAALVVRLDADQRIVAVESRFE